MFDLSLAKEHDDPSKFTYLLPEYIFFRFNILRFRELAFNRSPGFEAKSPRGYLHLLGVALGPPPEGIFSPEQFPRLGPDIGTENLLTNIALPVARACLEALRLLSLKCLSWEPAGRPTAQACLDFIEKWLSSSNPAPNFAELWLQHTEALLLGEPPELALPRLKSTNEDQGTYKATGSQKSDTSNLRADLPKGRSPRPKKHKSQILSPPEVPVQCTCSRSDCGWHKGLCANAADESSYRNFCSECTCQEQECGGKQVNRSGYCYKHNWHSSPPELLLIRALGTAVSPAPLIQEICPANLQVFRRVRSEYIFKFEELDPVFELVAAWLEHPWWMEAWCDNKLPPNSCSDDLVSALHKTIRQLSNRQSLEPDLEEPPRGGLGFLPCCLWLGVMEVMSPGAVLPASAEDLVPNIGHEKQTWRLVKAAGTKKKTHTRDRFYLKFSCRFKKGRHALFDVDK